jgi:CHASE1-domain containing sensor protein
MIYAILIFIIILLLAFIITFIIRENKKNEKLIELEVKIDDLENELKRFINKDFWNKNYIS